MKFPSIRLLCVFTVVCLLAHIPAGSGHADVNALVSFESFSISKDVAGSRQIEIELVPLGEHAAYRSALSYSLSAYAPDFLTRNLKRISVYKTMTVDGVAYGGTYDPIRKIVYLQASQIGKTTAGFHHEFSSILLANYGLLFPTAQWKAANPAGFDYLASSAGAEALARNSDIEGGPAVYEKGFIAGYGMTRLEEDVNTYFQVLMADPGRFDLLGISYPAIERKVRLLQGFLRSIGCGCLNRPR